MADPVTMFHPASDRTQQASRDAFDRVWSQQGWVLVERPAPAAAPAVDKPLAKYTVPELKAHADEHGIDLGSATKKAEILAAIEAADAAAPNDESGDEI